MKNIIEIKNLSFEYDKNNLMLDQLSLAIEENTINAILGSIFQIKLLRYLNLEFHITMVH